MKKWLHQPLMTVHRGRARISCVCGKQSPIFVDDELASKEMKAELWYQAHTKLVERSKR